MYDPDKDPEVIASRKKWAAGQQEFKRKLDEALARMRKAVMAQNTQTAQTQTPNTGELGSPKPNAAAEDIEEPFAEAEHLSPDNIVQRVEGETGAIVYDVIQDEKVLFSTLSAPLAHAFVQGYNAKAQRTAKTKKDEKTEGSSSSGPEVDPKEEGKTGKQGSSETGDDKSTPVKPKAEPAPAKAGAAPRKRMTL